MEEDRPKRISATEELAVYLWENYIEYTPIFNRGFQLTVLMAPHRCNDATDIFFIGVGDAFHGITHLLMNRGTHPIALTNIHHTTNLTSVEHCFQRTAGVINFVAENPLRPVHSQNIYWLSKWYIEVFLPSPTSKAHAKLSRTTLHSSISIC